MESLVARIEVADESRWIEPAQLVGSVLDPEDGELAVYCSVPARYLARHMRYTTVEDYQISFSTPQPMVAWMHSQLTEGCSIVIDNGTSAYTLIPVGGAMLLVDPHHTTYASIQSFDFRRLLDGGCLMALAVKRQSK